MTVFITHAAWTLLVAFVFSFFYEFYRARVKAGVSRFDSMREFVKGIPVYLITGIVIALLFTQQIWAGWIGLIITILWICVSIFYYNPNVMIERQPRIIDWIEDLVFTGLLFVAATQLIYALFW